MIKKIKKKKFLNLIYFLYGIEIQLLLVDCDKLLFLKKYKNIKNLMNLVLADKRIYLLIKDLLKYRIKYLC